MQLRFVKGLECLANDTQAFVHGREPLVDFAAFGEQFCQQREPIGHDDHLPDRAVSDETLLHQLNALLDRAEFGDRPAAQQGSPSHVGFEAMFLAVRHGPLGQLEATLGLATMLMEQRTEDEWPLYISLFRDLLRKRSLNR